jgi:hypothetical protein
MQRNQQQVMANQGGVSLSGLIVVLSYAEYRSIKAGIAKAKASGGTVAEMRSSFDKNADINNVTSIRSRDLVFSRDGGDTDISFAYEKRIALAGNVSLVIDYTGTTDSSGQVAAKTASAEQQ